ncbi:MAG TPA: YdcF family protein [Verrucomicrobiae bacterium]|nr:YdcF family protein [Verrucomicrobiae bacterium]
MKWLIGGAIGFCALVVLFISLYLSPNDLGKCDSAPTMTVGSCAPVDAIVAISGGDTPARTAEAIKLYQNGWAPRVLFAGAAQDPSSPSNAEAMRQQAITAGVPDQAILIEELSRTTAENALKTQSLFAKNNIKRIILVTSAYHQRRASLEFQKRLDGQVEVLNHPVAEDNHWSPTWWLTLRGWWLAGSELAKIIIFHLGGSF